MILLLKLYSSIGGTVSMKIDNGKGWIKIPPGNRRKIILHLFRKAVFYFHNYYWKGYLTGRKNDVIFRMKIPDDIWNIIDVLIKNKIKLTQYDVGRITNLVDIGDIEEAIKLINIKIIASNIKN